MFVRMAGCKQGTTMTDDFSRLAGGFRLLRERPETPTNLKRFLGCFDAAWQHAGTDQTAIQSAYRGGANVWLVEQRTICGIAKTGRADRGENFLMQVNSAVVFDLPAGDVDLTLVIAEELAHALLIATNDPTHVPKLRGDHEDAAQAVMERWGLDMAAYRRLSAWVASHCKNGVWDPLPWK
jgi:hypothetical protein